MRMTQYPEWIQTLVIFGAVAVAFLFVAVVTIVSVETKGAWGRFKQKRSTR